MKKSFLLVLLMALLPLAGWAADLTKGTLIAPSPFLGQEVEAYQVYNEANVLLVENTDYVFDGYFSDEACATPVTVEQIQAANAETTFWAKVTGKNAYEGSLKASFVIKKMPLTIIGTPGTKVYDGAEPGELDGPIFSAVTSVKDNTNTAVAAFAEGANLTFTKAEGVNKGEYAISATITDAALANNYIVYSADIKKLVGEEPVQAKYVITAKPFIIAGDDKTVTIEVVGTYTYTGATQTAEVLVKDIALGTTLVKDVDYTVADGAEGTNKNASATAVAAVTGKGNYDVVERTVNFTINKAKMLVSPNASRPYNGRAELVELPANKGSFTDLVYFDFQGFVGGETKESASFDMTWTRAEGEDGNVKWAVTGTPALSKNVGTYTLEFQDAAGNRKMNFSSTNYDFVPTAGTFKITPLADGTITLNTQNQTVETGANIDNAMYESLAGVLTPNVGATDEARAASNAAELAEVKALIEIVEDPDNAGKLIAQWKAATATNKAPENYGKITTTEKGTLTRVNASVAIGLKESEWAEQLTKVYDGEPISFEVTDKSKLIIIPATAASAVTVTNLVANAEGANAGAKEVILSGATAEGYDIVYIASNGKINPKPVTVTIPEQGIQQGAAIEGENSKFDTQNFTIEGLVEGENKDDIFELAIAEAKVETVGGVKQIKTGDGVAGTGEWISLVVKADADLTDDFVPATAAANYEYLVGEVHHVLTDKTGQLVITPTACINLDGETFNITNILAEVTELGGNPVSVTFADRKLKANVWTSMVLPFETSVLELSNALGYCVVDMLQESGSDMNFKLHMGDIPAYTPFLIKTGVEKNMDAAVLNEKVIVGLTDENRANLVKSNESFNFIGKVDNEAIATDFWAVGSKMTADDFIFNKYRAGTNLKAMRAYITAKTSGARLRIFVEEEDGTISEFNADEAATAIDGLETEIVETEGWYTIGGQKLEGAPTQKGIYINNGKKIVVK